MSSLIIFSLSPFFSLRQSDRTIQSSFRIESIQEEEEEEKKEEKKGKNGLSFEDPLVWQKVS